jgi:hypothetical protein
MRMIRWICGVSLRYKVPSTELRVRIGVEPVLEVCRRNRLRWFRNWDDDWMKRCTWMEVEGSRPRGRPRKRMKMLEDYMRRCALSPADAKDRSFWENGIHGVKRSTLVNLDVPYMFLPIAMP